MTATIIVNARMDTPLDWKKARIEALTAIAQGKKICWQIDLGLFQHLNFPLNDQTQYMSLGLALDHFRDTLWTEFTGHTEGVLLYRGTADFSKNFRWDDTQQRNLRQWIKEACGSENLFTKETRISLADFESLNADLLTQTQEGQYLLKLFCRDACAEYLDYLVQNLPDRMQPMLHLDTANVTDPILAAQLRTSERFPRFQLNNISTQAPIAICLPPLTIRLPSHIAELRTVMQKLDQEKTAYRIIPETFLTTEWDGLDTIYYSESGLTPAGKRKLQGFSAAGGILVNADFPIIQV